MAGWKLAAAGAALQGRVVCVSQKTNRSAGWPQHLGQGHEFKVLDEIFSQESVAVSGTHSCSLAWEGLVLGEWGSGPRVSQSECEVYKAD